MENISSSTKPALVTFADLCWAIASGRISASIEGGYYLFAQRELARVLSITTPLLPQPALPPCAAATSSEHRA